MFIKKFFIFIICLFIWINKVNALETSAKSSILMEYETGSVLSEENKDLRLPMASMTKMMSLLIIMEKIDSGVLKLDDKVLISENAAKMGGSQIFLEANTYMSVEELLKSICIASANDSVVALAEKIAGTEAEFIKLMNEKVSSLGLKNTNFVNVHGLDDDNHYSSAYDMAIIARELLHYDDILKYSSIYEDYVHHANGTSTWIVNTNKVVYTIYYKTFLDNLYANV